MADKAEQVILTTPVFRLGFPNLDKPSKMEGSAGDPKFGVTELFTPAGFTPADAQRWTAMRKAALAALTDKFGTKCIDQATKKILPAYKMPFRDGMEKPDKDGFGAGVVFVRASNKNPPGMAKMIPGGKAKLTHSDFYAGCYARASVSFWAFDNSGNKGVSTNLHNLLFIGDGARFGNQGPDVENDFADLGDEEITFGDDPLAANAGEIEF